MEILKKRFSWLTERNLLILLVFLTTALGMYIFIRPSGAFLSAFLFPWAIGMIYVAFHKHEIIRNAPLTWSVLSIAAFILSGIMTGEINTEWGFGVILLAFCSFFLLSLPRSTTVQTQHTELLSISTLLITLFMPFALLAMISVFTGRSFIIPFLENRLGIMSNGHVGSRVNIFSHTNITARFAVINILLAVYSICRLQRKPASLYFVLNILLNAMVLAHTQSRTCFIALAAGMAALGFRLYFNRSSLKSLRIPVSLLAAGIAFVLTLAILNGLYKADVALARSLHPSEVSSLPIQTRADVEGQFDIFSNGRDIIWLHAFKYLLDDPTRLIFGMGTKNMMERITQSYPIMAPYNHLHNALLECLARFGIPYLVSILGFLCSMIVPTIKVLLAPYKHQNRGIAVFPVIIGVLLIMSISEKMLFINADWTNILFYFACGHVLHAAYLQKSEKTVPEETT